MSRELLVSEVPQVSDPDSIFIKHAIGRDERGTQIGLTREPAWPSPQIVIHLNERQSRRTS
jgi:hypothetical protein